MNAKLIMAAAAASLFALPALAASPAKADAAPAAAAPMPEASAPSKAATGTAVNTAATAADLKTGASVTDASGADVGRITQVTPGKAGAGATVTLSAEGKTAEVPASTITVTNGALVSSALKADVWK
jgi:hypothetical protein